jgi:hypothetical protein
MSQEKLPANENRERHWIISLNQTAETVAVCRITDTLWGKYAFRYPENVIDYGKSS